MKVRLEQIPQGDDEVIIRYREMSHQLEELLAYLHAPKKRLVGEKDGLQQVIDPADILYIESVESKTFLYTMQDVIRVEYTLAQLEGVLGENCFFRCSKSMILNINKVKTLKSLASNRIDATMQSGEHILISRTYASEFRKRLKGGSQHD